MGGSPEWGFLFPFSKTICRGKDGHTSIPATKCTSPRLSPSTDIITSNRKGPHHPAQMQTLSSLTPCDLGGTALLISILQMWKLRTTKVKSLAQVTKQSWA